MTDQEFLALCKPGVTLEDFGKPMTEEQIKRFKEDVAKLKERQLERARAKHRPFRNYRITI